MKPNCIFVYGTLRKEFEKTIPYSKYFNKNTTSKPAKLLNAKLYYDSIYPYVIIDNEITESYVDGLLVFPEYMDDKLKEADKIEGNLYKRTISNILCDNIIVNAFVYIRHNISAGDIIVSLTDWTTVNIKDLNIEYLIKNYNLEYDIANNILEKTNNDMVLVKSLIKWNII